MRDFLTGKMFRSVTSRLALVQHVCRHAQRNIGMTAMLAEAQKKGDAAAPPEAPAAPEKDPIQMLFLAKIREYKSKSAGGKLVDSTPEVEARLKDALEKVDRMFSAKGQDMTKFPTFTFANPKLESVSLGDSARELELDEDEEDEYEQQEDNKPYFVK